MPRAKNQKVRALVAGGFQRNLHGHLGQRAHAPTVHGGDGAIRNATFGTFRR
jgi:hypothetical protein